MKSLKKKPTPERFLLISVPFGASANKLHTTHSLVCPFSSLVLKALFEVSRQIQEDLSEGGGWDGPRRLLRGTPPKQQAIIYPEASFVLLLLQQS